ncbi:MAG: excinuclease ABC subunit UvrC [Bacteroidales bacterium]|jgi:excinuclease ABC subunit C|nr:excinuclease ABC subunit UvrC [Bacteroidales bacterium]
MNPNLEILLKSLPEQAGVYQHFDDTGKLLYIGKAKNLKKRVNSYFNKDVFGKTLVLVKKIADIKFIVTDSEYEALLLENNLIKKYRPPYNVMLKDDKTYPWICIKNEDFPRVFFTRRKIADKSEYFGPYPFVKTVNVLLELIEKLYQLRNCNLKLDDASIATQKYRPCLNYHIKKCLAPCCGFQQKGDYNNNILEIKKILKGRISDIIVHLKEKMLIYAQNLEFEKANEVKNKMVLLEDYRSKSVVCSDEVKDVDVFSIQKDDDFYYVNFLKVIDGAVVAAQNMEMKPQLTESESDLLEMAVVSLRNVFESDTKEIIVPFEIETVLPNVRMLVPKQGEKKKLLEMSQRNIKYFILDKHKQESVIDPEKHKKRLLEQVKRDLSLPELPHRIECFDNSNNQGDYPVASMTVAIDGKLVKKEYRHFNIKTVEGANDFATMEEVIFRRYSRLLSENQVLPELLIVDGGKGQVSSAFESLKKLGLEKRIFLLGIAKRLEELFRPGDSIPLYLDKRSETLKLIQRLRDEAHRFGITHYRKRHIKGLIKTELTDIQGIGKSTSEKLLQHFHSVKKIKNASLEELSNVIGKKKAEIVRTILLPIPQNG